MASTSKRRGEVKERDDKRREREGEGERGWKKEVRVNGDEKGRGKIDMD